jgi:GNAT superfamily N-acetyltransferase
MSLRDRVARLLGGAASPAPAPERPRGEGTGESPPQGDVFVAKVDDAAPFVEHLFRAVFGDPTPSLPTHYVAFVRTAPGRLAAVGYYHVSYCGEYALVGGLCVDPVMRKRGVGELLERFVYQDAGDTTAYFAYVGDPARARRVGFVDTGQPHLLVCWMKDVAPAERERLISTVAALGPF